MALMGIVHQLHELYVECGRLRDAERLLQQSLEQLQALLSLSQTEIITMLGHILLTQTHLAQGNVAVAESI